MQKSSIVDIWQGSKYRIMPKMLTKFKKICKILELTSELG